MSFNFPYLKISFYSSRNSPPPASLTPGPTNSILKLNGNPGDGDNGASMLTPVSISKILIDNFEGSCWFKPGLIFF